MRIRRAALAAALPALVALPLSGQEPRRRISSPIAFYDDADITKPGMLSLSAYFAYDRVPAGHDVAVPSVSFNLGLHKRVDVSGSTAMVRSDFEQTRITAVADSDAGVRILILEEKPKRPAVAIRPSIEILGEASLVNNALAPKRVNYFFPVHVQKSFQQFRVYYTAGYVTRGIVFHALAGELDHWEHVVPTVVVSSSRLTRDLGLVSELGLNRSRSDILGGVAININPKWTLFANAGRSFGRMDPNTARYQVNAGVSRNLRLWGQEP